MHLKRIVFVSAIIFFMFNNAVAKKSKALTISYASGVTVCDDEKSKSLIETSSLSAVRYNETIGVLKGDFEFKRKIENLWKINVQLDKMTSSGSETMATHTMKNFCQQLKNKNEDTMYGQYLRAINFPVECPINPAKYTITDMVADTKEIPLNNLLVGDYKLTFTFVSYEEGKGILGKSKDTVEGCLYFICAVEQLA